MARLLWTLALLAALPLAARADELDAPFRVEAAGEAVDVEVGHAAPFVVDFDGDGKRDLLVGQFGGGKLRVYANVGTNEAPRFEGFSVFRAGEAEGTIPSG